MINGPSVAWGLATLCLLVSCGGCGGNSHPKGDCERLVSVAFAQTDLGGDKARDEIIAGCRERLSQADVDCAVHDRDCLGKVLIKAGVEKEAKVNMAKVSEGSPDAKIVMKERKETHLGGLPGEHQGRAADPER
jgi:hypothetical protein